MTDREALDAVRTILRDASQPFRKRGQAAITYIQNRIKSPPDFKPDRTALETVLAKLQGTGTWKSRVNKSLDIINAALLVPVEHFESVPAGANLQDVLRQAGEGAKLQLPSSLKLSGAVTPWPNQHLRGPCAITPAAGQDYGINGKTNEAAGCVYEDLQMSGFGRRALVPWEGSTVLRGSYNENGEMGIGVDGEGADLDWVILDHVETSRNGKAEWVGHGAAGYKFFHYRRSRVIEHTAIGNTGNGGWWDAECGDAEVHGGLYKDNQQKHLFFEKCGGNHPASYSYPGGQTLSQPRGVPYEGLWLVDGPTLQHSNYARDNGNGGVYMVASKNAIIKNIKASDNKMAVCVRNDEARMQDDHPGWKVTNVEIWDSTNDYGNDTVVIGTDVGSGVTRK